MKQHLHQAKRPVFSSSTSNTCGTFFFIFFLVFDQLNPSPLSIRGVGQHAQDTWEDLSRNAMQQRISSATSARLQSLAAEQLKHKRHKKKTIRKQPPYTSLILKQFLLAAL